MTIARENWEIIRHEIRGDTKFYFRKLVHHLLKTLNRFLFVKDKCLFRHFSSRNVLGYLIESNDFVFQSAFLVIMWKKEVPEIPCFF